MTCVELACTLQDRSRRGQFAARGLGTRLLQQVAQCILAAFQRRQVVRLQRQHTLEQRQRAAVAVVQSPRCKGIAGLCKQGADTGAGATTRLQLLRHRICLGARHLQLTRQRQRLRTALQVARLQPLTRLLQRCRAGAGQSLPRLRAVAIQRQHRLVAFARAAAVGRSQAPVGQRAITLGQQLFDLWLIPEPVGQRLAHQHQQHEHGCSSQQRPTPHPTCMARLQPPPAALAANAIERRMCGAV
ncbi:hypothetical protein D3C72_741170 [compost metagenome]